MLLWINKHDPNHSQCSSLPEGSIVEGVGLFKSYGPASHDYLREISIDVNLALAYAWLIHKRLRFAGLVSWQLTIKLCNIPGGSDEGSASYFNLAIRVQNNNGCAPELDNLAIPKKDVLEYDISILFKIAETQY